MEADRKRRRTETTYPLAYRHYDISHARVESNNSTADAAAGSSQSGVPEPFNDNEEGWETIHYPPGGMADEPIGPVRVRGSRLWDGQNWIPVETARYVVSGTGENAQGAWRDFSDEDPTAAMAPRVAQGSTFDPFDFGALQEPRGIDEDEQYIGLPHQIIGDEAEDRPIFAPYDDLGPTPADGTQDAGAFAEEARAPQHHVNTDADELFRLMTTYGDYEHGATGIPGPARAGSATAPTWNTFTPAGPTMFYPHLHVPRRAPDASGNAPRVLGRFRNRSNLQHNTTRMIDPTLDGPPPPPLRRRRRIDELDEATFASDEAYRNARRRTTQELADLGMPTPPAPRAQRHRHSRPPSAPRDNRRDGIVWEPILDEAELDRFLDSVTEDTDADRAV
jgi:hypothetical protein